MQATTVLRAALMRKTSSVAGRLLRSRGGQRAILGGKIGAGTVGGYTLWDHLYNQPDTDTLLDRPNPGSYLTVAPGRTREEALAEQAERLGIPFGYIEPSDPMSLDLVGGPLWRGTQGSDRSRGLDLHQGAYGSRNPLFNRVFDTPYEDKTPVDRSTTPDTVAFDRDDLRRIGMHNHHRHGRPQRRLRCPYPVVDAPQC